MNDAGSVLLSVRAEARQMVAPDYAVVDGLIEHTAGSKQEAVRSAGQAWIVSLRIWLLLAGSPSTQAHNAAR